MCEVCVGQSYVCLQGPWPPSAFVSVWDAHDGRVTLPLSSSEQNFTVEWGDGSRETVTDARCSHTFSAPGCYSIIVIGRMIGFAFDNHGDTDKIVEISQWGAVQVQAVMFHGCKRLVASATDVPDLSMASACVCASLGKET